MATDREIEAVEKRSEVAINVATLIERSLQSQVQLNRVEAMVIALASDTEDSLRRLSESVTDTQKDVDEKIKTNVQPLKDELTRYKAVFGTLASLATFVISMVTIFKEHIVKWIMGS